MGTIRKKRVYYHETRDVCEGLPDLLYRFPLRVLLVAQAGERVVLPAGSEPSELPLLNRLGFGPDPDDVIYVRDDGSISGGDADLDGAVVLPFSGTTERGRRFADLHGAAFLAPSRETCTAANSKRTFQQVCRYFRTRGLDVGPDGGATPLGHPSPRAVEGLVAAAVERFGKVVVKGSHSASGLQQIIAERGQAPDLADVPHDAVVQQWIEHEYSPSLHCVLEPDGDFRVLYATRQILDGQHHAGNVYDGGGGDDVPADIQRRMRAVAVAVCTAYGRAGLGYWGPLGIDFMVSERDGVVLACEVNARVAAPWYSWQAARRRFGKVPPFRLRSYALRPGTGIGDIEKAMKGLLFDRGRMCGMAPFCFVPEHGFVYGVTFAPSGGDLAVLGRLVDRRMADLAP